jgi:hypothetical protein
VADAKKKTAAKKGTSKKKLANKEVPPENYFILIDGSTLKDMESLVEAFDRMSEDVFRYHVNEFKNDFASWVQEVFDEKDLSEELKLAQNLERAHITLLKHALKKLKSM